MSFIKRKWLVVVNLILLALVNPGWMKASTSDVTSLYLKNSSFENDDVSTLTPNGTGRYGVTAPKGWTVTNSVNPNGNYRSFLVDDQATATDNNYGDPGNPSDGSYAYYIRYCRGDLTTIVSQKVRLPKGKYTLSVDSKAGSSKADKYIPDTPNVSALPIITRVSSFVFEFTDFRDSNLSR